MTRPDLNARLEAVVKQYVAPGSASAAALFRIFGVAWAGIWGGKIVQAWSQFSAETWDKVPLSDATHASMNHDHREVPRVLEQTPMPASGSAAGATGVAGGIVNIDTVDALARQIGFDARYQVNLPEGAAGSGR